MPRSFAALLLAAGLLLSASVVPGVFTVDEPHYLQTVLGLRAGRTSVPGTEGLPASKELLYFDPNPWPRVVERTPVVTTAPPLYAFLALPFLGFGWRGLVALNTLAFLGTAALVFAYARRHASERAGWLAAAAFGVGGFAIEYAQGMWPHMLSVFLAALGFVLAASARARGGAVLAAAAGMALGLAIGVRYQNVILAAAVGLGLVWLAERRRLALGAAFAAGLAPALVACALINHARLDSWNPISKGPGYLAPGFAKADAEYAGAWALFEPLHVFAAQVLDHTLRPPLPERMRAQHGYMIKDAQTGAFAIGDAWKKAWLQSSPWLGPALVVLAAALVGRLRRGRRAEARAPELAAMALAVFGLLAAFCAAGFTRTDGLCFNQRYLLELTPLVSVALAWSLEGIDLPRRPLAAGALAALIAALAATHLWNATLLEAVVLMKVPHLLAVALLAAWLWTRERPHAAPALALALGASLGWAAGVHAGEDLAESREYRRTTRAYWEALAGAVDERAAIFAASGVEDWLGPAQLQRDFVLLDARLDGGETAPALTAALLAQGRRVLVLTDRFPPPLVAEMAAGRPTRAIPPLSLDQVHQPPLVFLEIVGSP